MTRFLFLGGPLDQTWQNIPPGTQAWEVHALGQMVNSPGWAIYARQAYERVLYQRRRILVPGWRVVLTVYTSYPYHVEIPTGTVLPGGVQGQRVNAWSIELREELGHG